MRLHVHTGYIAMHVYTHDAMYVKLHSAWLRGRLSLATCRTSTRPACSRAATTSKASRPPRWRPTQPRSAEALWGRAITSAWQTGRSSWLRGERASPVHGCICMYIDCCMTVVWCTCRHIQMMVNLRGECTLCTHICAPVPQSRQNTSL